MRACALGMMLFAVPAFAEAPKIVVASAGECAGEERELALGLRPKSAQQGESDLAIGTSTLAHLTPADVAANAPLEGAPLPMPPAFSGPGACDTPGSGCLSDKLLEDPDPGTGCGFPGSACP